MPEDPKKSSLSIGALLPIADAAFALLEKIIPKITEAFKSGEISKEDQQKLHDRYAKLKESGFAFTRPPGVE